MWISGQETLGASCPFHHGILGIDPHTLTATMVNGAFSAVFTPDKQKEVYKFALKDIVTVSNINILIHLIIHVVNVLLLKRLDLSLLM